MDSELTNALRPVLVDILVAIDRAAGGGGEGALDEYKQKLARLEELGQRLPPDELRLRHFVEQHGFSQALAELDSRQPPADPA
ncbi:MAG: hypothetical protein QF719_10110 [Chloroflexota bacterium]|jgi:hypothetical protein|nr:hypothetical protein [Chloroflexota bacterium]MDP6509020.1 hypothetical protein [Chloroflexota bacterium]MDP6758535.1 hypothetical protein [Chloroflexota bacterium]